MRIESPVPETVLAAIRAPFEAEAAIRLDPPVVQPLSLFLDLAGEAMRARLFVVQADGRQEACLRPELTIPVARAHIAGGAREGRYAYEGKAFRAMPRGEATRHAEEFLQLGLEVYGDVDPAVEADIVALAFRSAAAGGRKDLALRLGDAALFTAFLAAIGVSEEAALRLRQAFGRKASIEAALDRAGAAPDRAPGSGRLANVLSGLSETEAGDLLNELWSLADIRPVGGRPAGEIAARLVRRGAAGGGTLGEQQADLVRHYLAIAGEPAGALDAVAKLAAAAGADLTGPLDVWSERLAALAKTGAPLNARFEAGFGRAFSYYDGFLFDVVSEALGEERAVAGGGRYDGLMTRLGASGAPAAVGCMVRPGRAYAEAAE